MALTNMENTGAHSHQGASRRYTTAFFVAIVLIWIALDRMTKAYFDGTFVLGETSSASYVLFHFRLVHNTGMAWGMFDDSTSLLAMFSCVICALVLVIWLLWSRLLGRNPSMLETLGLALLFAGGVGNAIDRFMQGYVVDFIEFTFIDFPVFNIADIGVTCGFVLVFVGYQLAERAILAAAQTQSKSRAHEASGKQNPDDNSCVSHVLSEAEGNMCLGRSSKGKRHE